MSALHSDDPHDSIGQSGTPRPGSRPVNAVKRVLRRRRKPAEPPALLRTPKPSLTYRLVSYLLVFPVYRMLFRGRTAGNANVPMEGALVVVANHGSHLDPPLLGHALGRPVAFMAKAELFKIPLLGPIIRACGAYPVARGASDREAIRTATDRLEQGVDLGLACRRGRIEIRTALGGRRRDRCADADVHRNQPCPA